MATYFISRHPAARTWIKQQSMTIDVWLDHLYISQINPGDCVIGILPLQTVFELCQLGITYYQLCIDVPSERRGQELSLEEMCQFNARLRQFVVSENTPQV